MWTAGEHRARRLAGGALTAWRRVAWRRRLVRARAAERWRAALREWRGVAFAAARDADRSAKSALLTWRRVARARARARDAVNAHVAYRDSMTASRCLNAWLRMAKYRRAFSRQVLPDVVGEVHLLRTLRRCAARDRAKRALIRWYRNVRNAHLIALAHWATAHMRRATRRWRAVAVAAAARRRRRRDAAFCAATASHFAIVHRAIDLHGMHETCLERGVLTPSPMAAAPRERVGRVPRPTARERRRPAAAAAADVDLDGLYAADMITPPGARRAARAEKEKEEERRAKTTTPMDRLLELAASAKGSPATPGMGMMFG